VPLIDPWMPARALHAAALRMGAGPSVARFGLRFVRWTMHDRAMFAGFEPSDRDVYVATWMKSGTNWMMQLALQTAWRGQAEFDHIHDVVPWPDAPGPDCVALEDPTTWQPCPTGKRIIKTHAPARQVPVGDGATALVVLRDPKDVLVSAYHFGGALLGVQDQVTPAQWLETMLRHSRNHGNPWLDHAAGWWALRDRPDVHIFFFSEMRRDLPGTVDRVAELLGVDLKDEERAAVIERSGFAWMKQNNDRFRPLGLPFVSKATTPEMVRKGGSSGGRELYTPDQLRRLDEVILNEIADRGLDLPYAEWFPLA